MSAKSTSKRRRLSSPADVRAWARENGMTVGERGKLPPEVIKEFNKAHKNAPYKQAEFVPTVNVRGVRVVNGRKVPIQQNVNLTEVRAAAAAAGVEIGARGRIPADILSAYVADPTFSTLNS